MFNGIFWGIILILFGILFLIKNYVNFPIPIFRTLFGILLIYWGVNVLFGGFASGGSNTAVFSESNVTAKANIREYNAIFGSVNADLTDIAMMDISDKIEVNAIFGQNIVTLPDNEHIIVKCSAAFGQVSTPDNSVSFLGDTHYTINPGSDKKPVYIEANAVFGEVKIKIVHIEEAETDTVSEDS
ncbi:MAG: hypothetical protein SVK54_00715 [candidate division WOR-3 bacterium]|nr:hypothetical protein [candidate division WOR-3 bacterium]